MTFKNEAQLKTFVLNKCKTAVIMAQERVYKIIERFMQEYYSDYSPELYERTYQLYRSLVKSEVISSANGFEAKVYFDLSSINYVTGASPSAEQVWQAASTGHHGAVGVSNGVALKFVAGNSGVILWNEQYQMQVQADAIEILKNMLIAEGIPIVKGY